MTRLIDADALAIDMVIEEAETPLVPWYPQNMPMRKTVGVSIEQINNAPTIDAVPRWIPCEERLPREKEVVLITNSKGNVRCGQFRGMSGKYWFWKGNTFETVEAWMPLPKPYKEEQDG